MMITNPSRVFFQPEPSLDAMCAFRSTLQSIRLNEQVRLEISAIVLIQE